MVKPPTVQIAGMLRALGRGIDTEAWIWLSERAGQRVFYPPNVSGWEESKWLDTSTLQGRWLIASYAFKPSVADPQKDYPYQDSPQQALDRALQSLSTSLGPESTNKLLEFSARCEQLADRSWKKKSYPAMRHNALRSLIAISPDYLNC
jgi:hypothetical protein